MSRSTCAGERLPRSFNAAVGDVDSDGTPDVIFNRPVSVHLGDGHGGFTDPVQIIPNATNSWDVALAYLNGDNLNDLIASNVTPPGGGYAGVLAFFNLAEPAQEVGIDVKPGSNRNPINLNSNGMVSVSILTTDDFDASWVDPTTVQFAEASAVQ